MVANKYDSNLTGLSFAEEQTIGVLPANPIFFQVEPNSFKEFGAQVTVTPRNPINPTRQRRKGSVTDLIATAGYMTDVKPDNLNRLMQGFFYAAAREKWSTVPLGGSASSATSVVGNVVTINVAQVGNIQVGNLVVSKGFNNSANNGLKVVTAVDVTKTQITFAGMSDEANPPFNATMEVVGFQFQASDLTITNNSGQVALADTSEDFTTFGLVPGEWMFIGGDEISTQFASHANNGFARVFSVTANQIVLDKTDNTAVTDLGNGKNVRLFFGAITKNETAVNLIRRYTYTLQRTLGQDANGTMAEYMTGSVPNEFQLNVKAAALVTADVTFTGLDTVAVDGSVSLKSKAAGASDIAPTNLSCYNTVSDFSRIRMYSISPNSTNPVPLAAYIMDATIMIKNSNQPDHAIGVLGAFDMTSGNFEIDGKLLCYFNSVAGQQSVRNCADITLDLAMTKQNQGLLLDIPLLALGEGRLNVVKDKPIELPLSIMGGQSNFGHTAAWMHFPYLPTRIAP